MDVASYCSGKHAYFEIRDKVPKTTTERVKKYGLLEESNHDVWDREKGHEFKR